MFRTRQGWHLLGGMLALTGLMGMPGAALAQLRIMPLGDSITAGAGSPELGGYRLPLWEVFFEDDWGAVFVGSQENGPRILRSKHHEGHGGWRIDQIDAQIDQWLDDNPPDVILLMIGTNDCMVNYQFGTVRKRMEHLIDKILQQRPDAYLVVSTLLPIADPAANARVQQFNRFLPDVVETRAKQGHHILLVGIANLLNPHKDFADGVHPNLAGYAKMAEVWLVALEYIVLFGWDDA